MSAPYIDNDQPSYTRPGPTELYTSNAGLLAAFGGIGPGTTETAVELFMSNLLSYCFPISQNWLVATKLKDAQGRNERDNVVFSVQESGLATSEHYVNENKRLSARIEKVHFDNLARGQLNAYVTHSSNSANTRLFLSVTIGCHIMFYLKMLHTGPVVALSPNPLHLWNDAATVTWYFEHSKSLRMEDTSWSLWTWREQHSCYERWKEVDGDYEYDYWPLPE